MPVPRLRRTGTGSHRCGAHHGPMPRTLTTLQHVVHEIPRLGSPGPHHSIGVAEGFGVLVVLFATALGLMMFIGHLRHQRHSRD